MNEPTGEAQHGCIATLFGTPPEPTDPHSGDAWLWCAHCGRVFAWPLRLHVAFEEEGG